MTKNLTDPAGMTTFKENATATGNDTSGASMSVFGSEYTSTTV